MENISTVVDLYTGRMLSEEKNNVHASGNGEDDSRVIHSNI